MDKIGTGNAVFDSLLNSGFETDIITTIYGPAGAGKTNFCILAALSAIKSDKKVIYIDTEGGFSIERFKQLSDKIELLENILFFLPTRFEEQKEIFSKLNEYVNNKIGLIIIDSISMLYRLELGQNEEVYETNRELGKQISLLTEISRKLKIPILITSQVYTSFEDNKLHLVGGDLIKYGSKCLIELQLNDSRRKAILRKHRSIEENKEIFFEIKKQGIFEKKEINTS